MNRLLALVASVLLTFGSVLTYAAQAAAPETVIGEALALDLAARRLTGAPQVGFTVYIGSAASDRWLREVWVQVDRQPMTRYLFSQAESEALRSGGLHLLLADTLTPGQHRVRAQAAAVGLDPRRNDDRSRAQVEIVIDQGDAPIELELSWATAAYVGNTALKAAVRQPTAAAGLGGAVAASDPRLRAIRFLDATGRRYRAELAFRQLQMTVPSVEHPLRVTYSAAATPASLGSAGPCEAAPSLSCDRINATLGYTLLDQSQGLKAAEAFRRVRAPGPYATAALLGLGWALLAPPDGEAAATLETAAEQPGRASRHPLRTMPPKERDAAIRAALVPWIELIGRDPTDPAVQEGLVAIAWALSTLGAQVQAQDYYNRAISQLTEVLGHVDKAKAELATTPLLAGVIATVPSEAWHWDLADRLPDPRWWVLPISAAPETFHLEALLQQPAFRERLVTLRDLHEAKASLLEQRAHLTALASSDAGARVADIDRLLPALDAGIAEQIGQADRLALAQLLAIKKQTQQTLVEARFGLAQLYDRVAEVATP